MSKPKEQDDQAVTIGENSAGRSLQVEGLMDLRSAIKVLQDIVKTDESGITESSDLTTIANYSQLQVRQALVTVVEKIVKDQHEDPKITFIPSAPVIDKGNMHGFKIGKEDHDCLCEMGLDQSDYDGTVFNPSNINMSLKDREGFGLIENDFQLRESEFWWDGGLCGFVDRRHETREVSIIMDLEAEFDLDTYKKILRGLRWMSANVLNWNNESIILPEDLDNHIPQLEAPKLELQGGPS